MRIINLFSGGKKNTVDKRMPKVYLVRLVLKYIFSYFRGRLRKLFIAKMGKRVFIGKNVTIYGGKYLYLGENVRIEKNVEINAISEDGLYIGDNVKIGDFSKLMCSSGVRSVGKGLKIGKNTFFSEYTFFGAAGGIIIGEDVISGQFVRFHSENHNFKDKQTKIRDQGVKHDGIIIGDNCWIGAGVVFLDGAKVGSGCVIGANSVVTGTFPNNVVLVGSPAKIIKKR